jgi:hypothetical protein
MTRISICIFIFLVSSYGVSAAEGGSYAEGAVLAQRIYDRPDGRDVSTRGVMILVEKGHKPRIRENYTYRADKDKGVVWSLTRFTSPADIEGTGLMTLDHGEESDQWLYLPALDRSRRISGNRKGGRFVGSDIFYEDLEDREVSKDRHRILGKQEFSGVECDVLESTPEDSSNSIYSMRVSWVHPKTLIPLRIDFFKTGNEKPIKQLIVHRMEKVQGYWSVMDSTMSDLTSGHSTRMKVERIVYDRDLPDVLFSRQTLEDPEREAAYRP